MSREVVAEFVAAYTREFDYYQAAARLCSQRCEALIGPRGVRAIVTHRAKRPAKLRAKLQERDKLKQYASSQQIRDDIPDLAGVRIALYFPGDRQIVRSILEENFKVEEQRTFPLHDKPKRRGKRFDGYHADHYRLFMQDSRVDAADKQYTNARIEVQVGSVLMHAWAEVEHDLIYKPENGFLSQDEEAILDEVNGLVLSGEIALERLQRALERRLGDLDASFDSHFDLAAYLHRWWDNGRTTFEPPMGRADVLWELLREAKLNNGSKLREYLGDPRDLWSSEPMSNQIADRILAVRPELYDFYSELLANLSFTYAYEHKDPSALVQSDAIGRFFSRWIVFERTHSIHSKLHGNAALKSLADPQGWTRKIKLSQTAIENIREARVVRNNLVHGIEIPTQQELDVETRRLDEILHELEHHPDVTVRDAYKEAMKPLGTRPDDTDQK